jgi:peptide/nickel transport system permease protein
MMSSPGDSLSGSMITSNAEALDPVVNDVTPTSRWKCRFLSNPIARISLALILIFAFLAGFTALLGAFGHQWPCDPNLTNLEQKLLPPSLHHWLGTDNLGRDVLSRMLHGASISLTVGLVAVGVSLGIGMIVGAISGYFGGITDQILMRSVDALLCFPTFFLILTAVAILGPSLLNIVVVIGLVSWTGTARLVRGEFLTLRETEYVKGARILGQNSRRIITRHILPNAAAPIFVTAVLGIPDAILTEAGLSFLGFGVQPPQATWGNIIADSKTYILDAWWLILFPGLAILIASLSFYLAGDALRESIESRN